MRRIIIIAAGPAGVACAAHIKHRLPEHEINLVIPSAVTAREEAAGPVGRRFAAALPDTQDLAQREIGVLETDDLMPDLEAREISIGSSRGRLTVRYSDLVLEVPATVRLPRPLQKADNVFTWPMPGFAASPEACDAALARAAATGKPVLVVGDGASALEAVFLAREAGAAVRWLRTKSPESPALEEQLLGVALKRLGKVTVTTAPHLAAEELGFDLEQNGALLAGVSLPDGEKIACACCFWTGPLMARHPVLREEGVVLDHKGRIVISDAAKCPGLRLMGSGSALEDGALPFSGAPLPAFAGGDEQAWSSAFAAIDDVSDKISPRPPLLARREARGAGLVFYRAGLSLAEAQAAGLDCEYACLALPEVERQGAAKGAAQGQGPLLALALTCDRASRTLIGVQVLGAHPAGAMIDSSHAGAPESASGPIQANKNAHENASPVKAMADGLFAMAGAALAGGISVELLARSCPAGASGELLARSAEALVNKFETIIKGISPAEFMASHEAGAEFFTLDLRSLPDWRQGHVPGAYNIPLSQLKKRIQDEVPRFTPIVAVSAFGRDAYIAASRMAALGAKDLYVLDGGMALWPYEEERG